MKQIPRPSHRLKSSVKTAVKMPQTIAAMNAIAPADIPFHPTSRSKRSSPVESGAPDWPASQKCYFYLYSKNCFLSPCSRTLRQILRSEVTIANPSLHT
jgi:hypothetical protein